jgi:protein SCO1/2
MRAGVALLALGGVASVLASAAACGAPREEIPALVPIGPFAFVDQRGATVDNATLRGEVWVADFIFTECPDVCPVLSTQMSNLARRLEGEEGLRFVSISVDPEQDTPEVLAGYAARFDADPTRWSFLTGPPEEVRATVQRSFMVPVGAREPLEDGRYDITHDPRFFLVDADGVFRGTYETNREGLERLERHVRQLLRQGGR